MKSKGLTTPVSSILLISSFTIIILATYNIAVSEVNVRSYRLNYAAAKHEMIALADAIHSVSWSPKSSLIMKFHGYGGEFEVNPDGRRLIINVSDGSVSAIIFNSTIGYVEYELPAADRGEVGWYLRGSSDPIVNQSFREAAQMYIRGNGDEQKIYLGYRPLVFSYTEDSEEGIVNVIRILVINLNSSENILSSGSFQVRIRCLNITGWTRRFGISDSLSSVNVKAIVDGNAGSVIIPLLSEGDLTLIRLELLICNIRIEKVIG